MIKYNRLFLTDAEREWLQRARADLCKYGHSRHDARLYRNERGSLWLDCIECARKRVNAYSRRMRVLQAQAR